MYACTGGGGAGCSRRAGVRLEPSPHRARRNRYYISLLLRVRILTVKIGKTAEEEPKGSRRRRVPSATKLLFIYLHTRVFVRSIPANCTKVAYCQVYRQKSRLTVSFTVSFCSYRQVWRGYAIFSPWTRQGKYDANTTVRRRIGLVFAVALSCVMVLL